MAIIREEIYDDNGLVEVREIEVPDVDVNQVISDKEAQLLAIYEELQALKGQQ